MNSLASLLPLAQSYADARSAFRSAARDAGMTLDCETLSEPGPDGDDLSTDWFWRGPQSAERVLVLISGTHGVEGYAGSALQTDWLQSGAAGDLPPGLGVLVIHALNAHGFAWTRRVTEEGVDLNRNFIDFDGPMPANVDYDDLHNALVPADWFDPGRHAADARLYAFANQNGKRRLEDSVTAGQYSQPDGLFYGGKAPTRARRLVERLIADYALGERASVAVLDIHTGLGPYGYGEIICDHAPGSLPARRGRDWFGPSMTEPALGTSTSGIKAGLMDYGWHRALGDQGLFVTLEFGTTPSDVVIDALRGDNWLHRRGSVDWTQDDTLRVKQAMLEAFRPYRADWRDLILFRGRQVIDQAITGLLS
ncbi:MAG: M14 family metallopeptidase [Rhodospirillales bacterium]